MGAVHLKALQQIPSIEVAVVSGREQVGGRLKQSGGKFSVRPRPASTSPVFPNSGTSTQRWRIRTSTPWTCVFPTHLHETAAVEALEAGKHVLLEKPMALDLEACLRLIDLAHRRGRILMVAQVLRFFPAYRVLASALKSAGPIRVATFRRRCAMPAWGDWQSDPSKSGGAVLDLLIHDIDMALHLFGAPSAIEATGNVGGEIDLVSSRLFYDAGFAVEIVGGWHPGKFPLTMKRRDQSEKTRPWILISNLDFRASSAHRSRSRRPAARSRRPLRRREDRLFPAESASAMDLRRSNVRPRISLALKSSVSALAMHRGTPAQWRKDPVEIGVMFWAGRDRVEEIRALGVALRAVGNWTRY